MGKQIWLERVPFDGSANPARQPVVVCWDSDGMVRRQRCADEDQARSFAAGLEEGLQEALRVLADVTPRLSDSHIMEG